MKKSFIKKLSYIFMLCIISILSSIIGLQLHDFNVLANTTTNGVFTGLNGSPEGKNLYDLTNTYNYKGDNTNFDRKYEYYDTSINGKNNNTVSTDAPLITVLTHGLGGDASHWSNVDNVFSYDKDSIIARLETELSKNGGNCANVYWAVMENSNTVAFKLYDLKDEDNWLIKNEGLDTEYIQYKKEETTNAITDITKHTIIVFEASYPSTDGYNYKVYEEFNYMLSKIVYDVKTLSGGVLPKINLIGHSRGGITNLQYALDHPDLVESIFSIGTPYFGSDTAATHLGEKLAPGNGRLDIIDRSIYLSYFNRWNNDFERLYSNIDAHALGGYSNTDFVFDALIDSGIAESVNGISNTFLECVKTGLFHNPVAVNTITLLAEAFEFLRSFIGGESYTEQELHSYAQIVLDIQYTTCLKSTVFSPALWYTLHNKPYPECPYFMNDLLVELSSQIGYDRYNLTYQNYGFKEYTKCFTEDDYNIDNPKKLSNYEQPAIVHNLEARDKDLINYILTSIPLGTFDADYVYEQTSETTATLIGYRGEVLSGHVMLPSRIHGLLITRIGTDLFKGLGGDITEITLPDTVEEIENSAFIGLNSLQVIIAPYNSGLTSIGSMAFSGCTSLTSINMPNSVEFIGFGAFSACTSLTTIKWPTACLGVSNGAFKNCTSLKNITIPNNITCIWKEAFYGCESLESIHIPKEIEKIDYNAFSNCTSLNKVYFYSFNIPLIANNSFDKNREIKFYVPYNLQRHYNTKFNENSYSYDSIPITINFYNENEAPIVVESYFGASVVLPVVSKEGFVFDGWYNEDGNEYIRYTDHNEWAVTEDLNLYARWQVENLNEQYSVTLDWGDGRISEITVTYDRPIVVDSLLTRQHYKFEGFYSEPNRQGNLYVKGLLEKVNGLYQIVPESTFHVWPYESDGTLYAYWEPIVAQCTILVLGTDVNYEAEETIEITSGTPITLNAIDYANGNAFSSWEINGTTYTTESVTYTFELRLNPLTGNYTIYYFSTVGGMASTEGYITLFVKKKECVAAGTLITLADGRQVPVETLTGNEMLLVWNMRTGTFDVAPILFIDQDALATYKIINLQFSDGTQVKVISEHAFFDCNLNKYVYLREDAGKYIGHWFNKQTTDTNGNMIWTKVQLTNVSITQELTTAYSPVTYDHLCLYVNGMLSMPGGIDGFINIFEVDGETMQINQTKYLEDIATYGLFTYEEFYELFQVPEEMFEACGGQYLKVAIGKGLLDYERLGQLIERYAEFFA